MRFTKEFMGMMLAVCVAGCQNPSEDAKPVAAEKPVAVPTEKKTEEWPAASKPEQSPGTPLPGVNLAVGKPYTLSIAPNYAYCTDPDDAKQLTDGKFSEGYFWVQKSTVGWCNSGHVEVIIDLGAVEPISAIAVNSAGGRAANVNFPDAVFFVSEDGVSFQSVGHRSAADLPSFDEWYVRKHVVDGLKAKGRYVAVSLASNGSYLFADEIEVMKGDPAAAAAAAAAPAGPSFTKETLFDVVREKRKMAREQSRIRKETKRMIDMIRTVPAASAMADEATALERELDKGELDLSALASIHGKAASLNARIVAAAFPGKKLLVWQGEMWKDFSANEFPSTGSPELKEISVTMGCDEYESAAFMLFNPSAAVQTVRVVVSDLAGKDAAIPAKDIAVRTAAYVDSSDGVLRPDALPLVDDGALVVPSGENRLVWLTLKTTGQHAGDYRGAITLSVDGGSHSIALAVRVVGVALPRPLPVATYNWAYFNFVPFQADVKAGIADLAAHHIDTAVLDAAILPHFVFDAQGNITSADFASFDEAIKLYMAAGIKKFWFFNYFGDCGRGVSQPLGTGNTSKADLKIGSSEWKNAVRQLVVQYVGRCQSLGLGYDSFVFYPIDEPTDTIIDQGGQAVWSMIKEADPEVKVFVDPQASLAGLAKIAPAIDIWCPLLAKDKDLAEDQLAFYRAEQKAGKSFVTYNCQDSDKTFPPLGHYRRMLWRCWNLGITGAGFWAYADTGHVKGETSAWTDFDGGRVDFSIVYDAATAPPGVSRREAQIPSRRWEAWRDGVEDYAYLWLLRDLAGKAKAERKNALAVAKAEALLASTPDVMVAQGDDAQAYDTAHAAILDAIDNLL